MFVLDTSSDPLEKMFGKLRQGSGGTYFVNVQQVLQKVTKRKTKLCLDLGVNIEEMEDICGHSCEKCGYLMNGDETFNVFHNLFSPCIIWQRRLKWHWFTLRAMLLRTIT